MAEVDDGACPSMALGFRALGLGLRLHLRVQGPFKVQGLRRVDDLLRGTVAATSNTNGAVARNLCNPASPYGYTLH